MKNKVLMGLVTIALVAALSSCGKKPQAEIDSTNAAIEAAKSAESSVYVPAEFAALQDSMNVVLAEIAAQDTKLFKKYAAIKVKLESVSALAATVATNASVKKDEVKKEVESAMAEINVIIEENKTLMSKAPKGKEGTAVLEQMKSEMVTIESGVSEAQGLFDKGMFMDAQNKVKAANELALGINTELKEAIAKVKARR